VVWFEWLSIFPANMKALSSTPVPPKKFPYWQLQDNPFLENVTVPQ
jgi:hypothetical protein